MESPRSDKVMKRVRGRGGEKVHARDLGNIMRPIVSYLRFGLTIVERWVYQ